jgi:hypothetical protein
MKAALACVSRSLVNVSYQYSIVSGSHNFQYFLLILYYCFNVFYHNIQTLYYAP